MTNSSLKMLIINKEEFTSGSEYLYLVWMKLTFLVREKYIHQRVGRSQQVSQANASNMGEK